VKRRLAAQYVRNARDRLTSTRGTRPAFGVELLRQFAQTRQSASLLMLVLVGAIGLVSALWTGTAIASAWTASVLVIHVVVMRYCRLLLELQPSKVAVQTWRRRFVTLDLFQGLAWMFMLIRPVGVDESSGTFMLFVMLLIVAVSSMVASSLPIAVLAATFPVTAAVALDFVLQGSFRDFILAAMAVSVQGYFAVLAYRLYSTTLATLEARAEKDALIGELEQSRAVSDEARMRAEESNLSKSRFLAQMSHELRTPLNAIIGFSEIMESGMFGPLGTDKYREYCSDILSSGQYLLDVINDILDMAKIEAGRIRLDFEELDLDTLLSEATRVVSARAQDKQLEVVTKISPNLSLRADRRALKQIVLNLLSNAVKFTPVGGRVTVRGRDVDGCIILAIADTGIGIASDALARLGRPFEQVESQLTKRHQGSGLGLAISKSLVELHGGRMRIRSTLGKGTLVMVRLPKCPQCQLPKEEAA